MREFQTLPGRVHPEMHMTTSAGFILSGIYVGIIPSLVQLLDQETKVDSKKGEEKEKKKRRRR